MRLQWTMMKPDPYTVRLELPLVRVVIAASILIVLSANAVAQCKSQPAQLADLESHLNGTLAQLAKIVPEQRPKEYRELQEQALRELEQVQCAREEAAPAEAVRRGPALKTPFALVPVLFVTDRQPLSAPHDGHKYFGWERVASGVTYGRVVARMPAEDYSVTSPVPHGVKIVTEANAQGGVSVDAPETLTREDITKHIRDYKASLPHGELTRVLIFVHGFNVTYPEAIQALARLSFGLHIDVLPVALSWPSQGSLPKYWNDEENIEPSIERLRPELLWLLSHPDIDEVILVAHSMGSRLVTRTLSQLELQKAQLPKLTRIALAAADLYEGEFRELWPRIRKLPAKGWLFYTSANDLALLASSIVHAAPPIGDSRKRVFTVQQADTVDASAVAPKLRGYGHSYVIDNPLLRVDLRRWVAQGLPAAQRGLTKESRTGAEFWEISH